MSNWKSTAINFIHKTQVSAATWITVYEESCEEWQNVMLCLETGEITKGIHICELILTQVFTAFYIQCIYNCGCAQGTEK